MALTKPNNETSWVRLGIIFLIFLSALFLIFYFGGDALNCLKKGSVQPPSRIEYESFRIAEGDQVGRTIFYKEKEGPIVRNETGRSYLGEGQVFTSGSGENPTDSYYLVGPFLGWQEIENSADKYIIIRDPSTEMLLFFVSRVVLEGEEKTRFFVEDLKKALEQGDPVIEPLGNLSQWDWAEIEKIIMSEDTIVLRPAFDEEGVVSDETGRSLILELIIRRFDGKAQLEKELGRQIP